MNPFKDAARINTGLLGAAERRALIWIAGRLPRRVSSDHLTGLGFFAMLMAGVSYAFSTRRPILLWAVVFWLAVNWFGDSLDGTLARVRRQTRPRYGFYVDHVLDSLGALCLLAGLALSGRMTPLVAAAVLIAYFLLSIEIYLAAYCVGRFEMSHWGLGPTELRIALAIGTLALRVQPTVTIAGARYLVFDVGGVVAAAAMTVIALAAMARHTAALYAAEPLVPGRAVELLHDLPDHPLRVAEEH
jgi:archaetidylinositol phosphate synthase